MSLPLRWQTVRRTESHPAALQRDRALRRDDDALVHRARDDRGDASYVLEMQPTVLQDPGMQRDALHLRSFDVLHLSAGKLLHVSDGNGIIQYMHII